MWVGKIIKTCCTYQRVTEAAFR
ncbi:hypothetical protein OH492_17195 [Vibrio chagasii]|nr:hypothetical protein [Vibrio chagasii]